MSQETSEIQQEVKCPICLTTITLIADSKLRFCQCKMLGVDCAKEYTRYLGLNPNTIYNQKFIKETRMKLNITDK